MMLMYPLAEVPTEEEQVPTAEEFCGQLMDGDEYCNYHTFFQVALQHQAQ